MLDTQKEDFSKNSIEIGLKQCFLTTRSSSHSGSKIILQKMCATGKRQITYPELFIDLARCCPSKELHSTIAGFRQTISHVTVFNKPWRRQTSSTAVYGFDSDEPESPRRAPPA